MKLYHWDREGTIDIQNGLGLQPLNQLPAEVSKTRFVSEFKDGISFHGINYLDNKGHKLEKCMSMVQYPVQTSEGQQICNFGKPCIDYESFVSQKRFIDSKMIEFNCEMVRRAYFPHYISRFQCLFAVDDVSEFSLWPELDPSSKKYQILEIELNSIISRFDSNWLKGGLVLSSSQNNSYLGYLLAESFDLAYNYWSGAPTTDPRWEYLIPLPIAGCNIHRLNKEEIML